MPRWKKEDATPKALYLREWIKTETGQKYREQSRLRSAKYREANKDRVSQAKKAATRQVRLEALQHYSGLLTPECKCCGEAMFEFLTIDHVNGDGAAHRRELGMAQGDAAQVQRQGQKVTMSSMGFVYWLKKNNWPEGFQVLCFNCNAGKRAGKHCPHHTQRQPHPDQLSFNFT